MEYKNYVFDLYGTLVDIKTDEEDMNAWSKLSLFYGYYDALYDPEELKERYFSLVNQEEDVLGSKLADVHDNIIGFEKGYETILGEEAEALNEIFIK